MFVTPPFFKSLPQGQVKLSLEDVDGERSENIYSGLIAQLDIFISPKNRDYLHGCITPFARAVLAGPLTDDDFRKMYEAFTQVKNQLLEESDSSYCAYLDLKRVAMFMGMMLFVDNCRKEGLEGCLDKGSIQVLACVEARFIQKFDNWNDTLARFAANYFFYQLAFDRLFVPDKHVLDYDTDSGEVSLGIDYHAHISYLALASRKMIYASDWEKRLSYALTTGWGLEASLEDWRALNTEYYGRSESNFFSHAYEDSLERMLPQFAFSKMRAAESILNSWDGHNTLHIVEMGAGSGSFAVELWMAAKRLGLPVGKLAYTGVEPSPEMLDVFGPHFEKRTGQVVPSDWKLKEGSLESFIEDPKSFSRADGMNALVFSFSAHHCYGSTLNALLVDASVQMIFSTIWILEGTLEHGWTKWTYMPLDVRSPENFNNVAICGSWSSQTLWHEPERPLDHHGGTLAWAALRRLESPLCELFKKKPAFLLDLDGTVYRGEGAIPGAIEFLSFLRQHDLDFAFLTNRSERTADDVVQHLARIGFAGVKPHQVFTSSQVAARAVAPGKAWYIGREGLKRALIEEGHTLDDVDPDYVFVGINTEVTYTELQKATRFVLGGAQLVITNPDHKFNTDTGLSPGNGAIAASIQTATGVTGLTTGKPEPQMFRVAASSLDYSPENCLVIGDNLRTDIQGANQAGCKSAFVLTGVNQRDDLLTCDAQPNIVIKDLFQLKEILQNLVSA